MHDLIEFFRGTHDAEAIEEALCEDEVVIINDDQEEPEMIVEDFAEYVQGLGGRHTANDNLEISFQGRRVAVKLSGEFEDGDIVRWAVRDVLLPDYEIRVLRSCLGTDTLAFVVDKPEIWQQIEAKAPEQIAELFVPFTDAIGFDVDIS